VEDIYCDLGALVNGGQLVVAIRPS